MKLYEIIIKPRSGFGTPLKGDTLFGHFCWQVRHDEGLLNGGMERWIAAYGESPFAVFSTAWPRLTVDGKVYYALKRPDLPLAMLFPSAGGDRMKQMAERKEREKLKWLLADAELRIDLKTAVYKSEQDLATMAYGAMPVEIKKALRKMEKRRLMFDFVQPHNTIDRLTQTTGEGMFSPYSMPSVHFYPGLDMAVFALIDGEATDIERVGLALERIGRQGFGRDASTGLGRFDLGAVAEKSVPGGADACYTLAPSVPEKGAYRDCYFTPFTRFGRHGDALATSGAPFKNPVIMADEGAVLIPADRAVFGKPYLGTAVRNLSKIDPRTVSQGYAPYLPVKLEMQP